MEEKEAAEVLVALAQPLEWCSEKEGDSKENWLAEKEVTEARYTFYIHPPDTCELGCDSDGIPFHYLLEIVRWDFLRVKQLKWEFPCRTVEEAKGICERLVLTDSPVEAAALDRLRYPLVWETFFCSRRQCVTYVRKDGRDVARYVISRRRRWFFPYYTAVSELTEPTYQEHRQAAGFEEATQEAYLQAYNLRPASIARRRYKTLDDAQAACEQHHWTGNWE